MDFLKFPLERVHCPPSSVPVKRVKSTICAEMVTSGQFSFSLSSLASLSLFTWFIHNFVLEFVFLCNCHSFIVNASSFTTRSFIILDRAQGLLDACISVCLVGIALHTDTNIGCDYFHTSVYTLDSQIPPTLYIQMNFVQ